eukprot:GHVN01081769.1.p1 GENE.GHVN01081769.1~~GHVN01081769.1.p1  ORF type:complete len:298 (+),score=38.73 GHVN01081769.1:641-1534(+)
MKRIGVFDACSTPCVVPVGRAVETENYLDLSPASPIVSSLSSSPSMKQEQLEAILTNFVEKNKYPLITKLEFENFFQYSQAAVAAAGSMGKRLLAVAMKVDNTFDEKLATLKTVARKYQDEFIFGYVDALTVRFALQEFNVWSSDLPRVFIMEAGGVYYEDIDRLRLDNLEEGIELLFSGSLVAKDNTGITSWPRWFLSKLGKLANAVGVAWGERWTSVVLALLGVAAATFIGLYIFKTIWGPYFDPPTFTEEDYDSEDNMRPEEALLKKQAASTRTEDNFSLSPNEGVHRRRPDQI